MLELHQKVTINMASAHIPGWVKREMEYNANRPRPITYRYQRENSKNGHSWVYYLSFPGDNGVALKCYEFLERDLIPA